MAVHRVSIPSFLHANARVLDEAPRDHDALLDMVGERDFALLGDDEDSRAPMLGAQFDAVFHLDETTAVEPLDVIEHWIQHEPADTWPSGL